jgi:hypothetical protein
LQRFVDRDADRLQSALQTLFQCFGDRRHPLTGLGTGSLVFEDAQDLVA